MITPLLPIRSRRFADRSFSRHWLSIAVLGSLALGGCRRHETAGPAADRLPSAPVRVQSVENKTRLATEEVIGTVRARLRATLEAKVSGRLDKMLATPGLAVKAGDLLASLDVGEIRAKRDQAVAQRDQAERELRRFSTLLQEKAVTQQEYDAVESRHRVARAAAAEAESMLGYAAITAPFGGVITRQLANVGDFASPGRPLLELEDLGTLRLEADVPEAIIERVQLGAKLAVRLTARTDELEGTVGEIAPSADPNSRTYQVKLDLPSAPGLRAGQFGRVAVPIGETTALRVPVSAVVKRGQMEMIFVAVNHRAQMRLVKTGKSVGGEIELVSGVHAGENVVIEGAPELADGQRLEVKP